ncbi:MAG: hypoxanthine phosphoribosyltransferase [Brumimicrobium sp.]|nr:hypoxanthine phosphoribosyltransferase [Brumimicrobium sp.]
MEVADRSFELFLTHEEIQEAVKNVASKINTDYENKEIVFVGVLNGVFMFASDLIKHISVSCEVTFIKVQSYQGTSSSGKVTKLIGLSTELEGKHVIILEDIVDTGLTLEKLHTMMKEHQPQSFEVATLLFKPDAFKGKTPPKYIGKEIQNKFIVGYGLDYQEKGRNLKDIYKIKE